jgi:hypothetical protein
MIFNDHVSGEEVGLKYRLPTDIERIEYQDQSFQFKNGKLKTRAYQTRIDKGMAILTGIVDGAFEVQRSGQWVPISSDPNAQAPYIYEPRWREVVREDGADLVANLAMTIFEPSTGIPQETEDGAKPKNSHSSQPGILTLSE